MDKQKNHEDLCAHTCIGGLDAHRHVLLLVRTFVQHVSAYEYERQGPAPRVFFGQNRN